MTDLQKQLKETIQEREQIRKIKEHIAQLTDRLAYEEKALKVMEETLTKEQRDVEMLEREGLTTMFRKFLGDREERLEKEKEEYLRASLRFNELYKSVQLIRFEVDLLSKKEQSLEAVERRIETLITSREKELMDLNPPVALVLKEINQQTDRLHQYSVEVEEAFAAGTKSSEFVRNAEQYLINAKLMGQRDMWGSQYHRTSTSKHEAIDRAREMAHQARHALIHFGNELRDVFKDTPVQFNIEIENFGRFADIFFDNLISDFLVQQKISKSLVNVTGTRQQVDLIMQNLQHERDVIRQKLEKLEEERKRVVVSS